MRFRVIMPREVRRIALRRHISVALIATGGLMLAYVVCEYGAMIAQQRRLARMWRSEQERVATAPNSLSFRPGTKGLTRISIPRIGLDAIVVEGTDTRALSLGPGHMENTSIPGDNGNSVITGHRDTFFRRIGELNAGDDILVQRNGRIFTYEVSRKQVVEPNDLSVIRPTRDAELTLITCYPSYYIGPAPERLVVFSRLVTGNTPQTIADTDLAGGYETEKPSNSKLLRKRAASAQ
jgi:LPXTG-site transpeptidase (sortase) family protein